MARRVVAIAGGVDVLGVRPGDRVGLVHERCAEWVLADLGAISAGGVVVPLHARTPPDRLASALDHSEARLVFVEDRRVAERLRSVRHRLPHLEHVVLLDGEAPDDLGILSLTALESLAPPGRGEARFAVGTGLRADAPVVVDYQAFEGAKPRGVVLTHRNIMGTLRALRSVYGGVLERVEQTLICLPPVSLRERLLSVYLPLYHGVTMTLGRGLEAVMDDLTEVRPGYLVAIPRVLEGVRGQLSADLDLSPSLYRWILAYVLSLGRAHSSSARDRRGLPVGGGRGRVVADRLILSRLRERLGDRLELIVCGGAPLAPDTADFFGVLGAVVSEGWGCVETTAVATTNPPTVVRAGSVGRPLPGVEVRAETDGELCVRGVNVFAGYRHDPEATSRVMAPDGFVRTGEVGWVDRDGFVYVTGPRGEEITVTGGGRIMPRRLESLLRARPLIADAFVYGDRRPYIVALLTIDQGVLEIVHPTLVGRWAGDVGLRRLLEAEVRAVNRSLPREAQIHDFQLLSRDFSIEAGELDAALGIRRRAVEDEHRLLLERMYLREPVASKSA